MKKIYILLLINLVMICGCENKEEATKNEYITMKNNTLNEENYTSKELPVEIITTIERINEEDISYKTTITNPKENMHDIKVLLVHNYHNDDVFPSVGVFNESKELLVDNEEKTEITLQDTIKTTKNISKLNLELKMLIEYTNDNGEKKDIYYKTT